MDKVAFIPKPCAYLIREITRMSNIPPEDFLDSVLETADSHANRLILPMDRLKSLMQLSADFMGSICEDQPMHTF